MSDQERLAALYVEIAPKLQEFQRVVGVELSIDGSDREAAQNWFYAEAPSYPLDNILVVLYLSELLSENTTSVQWVVGRELFRSMTTRYIASIGKMGRRPESADRFFVFLFVEWAVLVREKTDDEAYRHAAKIFEKPSYEKLKSWYTDGKGRYSMERNAARLVSEIFLILSDSLGPLHQDWLVELLDMAEISVPHPR